MNVIGLADQPQSQDRVQIASAQSSAHDQRRRAPILRSNATDEAHGNFQDKTSMARILFALFTSR
jgi:hypothetical protein